MTVSSARPEPNLTNANLICMLSMLIWASGLPAADHLIPLLAPEQLNALRMLLAAGTLVPFWALMEGTAPLVQVNWLRGIWVGSLIGLGAWLLIEGQSRSGAVTAAAVAASLPVVGITIEVVMHGRKLTRALIIGLLLSLVGGFLALDLSGGGLSMGYGALFCFGAIISFALGSRLTVTAFPDQSSLGRTAVTLTGAAIASTAAALLQSAFGSPAPSFAAWGAKEIGALLLFSVGALGISQALFIISVERLGIGLSSLHVNAAPFYVMLIIFGLGGPWDWSQVAAACLVALGVLIAQGLIPLRWRGRR